MYPKEQSLFHKVKGHMMCNAITAGEGHVTIRPRDTKRAPFFWPATPTIRRLSHLAPSACGGRGSLTRYGDGESNAVDARRIENGQG